eukprot:13352726-Alexandrium_andersonii.AAC.1
MASIQVRCFVEARGRRSCSALSRHEPVATGHNGLLPAFRMVAPDDPRATQYRVSTASWPFGCPQDTISTPQPGTNVLNILR